MTPLGLQQMERNIARSRYLAITGYLVGYRIDDNGVGFDRAVTPWSIASRVREVGGEVTIAAIEPTGAHLSITLPAA